MSEFLKTGVALGAAVALTALAVMALLPAVMVLMLDRRGAAKPA